MGKNSMTYFNICKHLSDGMQEDYIKDVVLGSVPSDSHFAPCWYEIESNKHCYY
jgi:hypothetical protein